MAMRTCLDDLPDLIFIELLTYLSSFDVLWSFIHLNHRIDTLINERGFFRQINLTTARVFQFNTLLSRFPLDQIQTLIIHIEGSPLQLCRYPHLPRLSTLRLYGIRDVEEVIPFIIRHGQSLVHLTVDLNESFTMVLVGYTGYKRYPRIYFGALLESISPYLIRLRSLDLGRKTGEGLSVWNVSPFQCPLTYLRLPVGHITQLCHLMAAGTLCTTLEQLHVTLDSLDFGPFSELPENVLLPKFIHVHTFVLIQSLFSLNRTHWSTFEVLTGANVMPVLRRMNLVIFVNNADLDAINKSALFHDGRQIDVQFAFIVERSSQDIQPSRCVPRGSRFHPRQIVGVTCVGSRLLLENILTTSDSCLIDHDPFICDVWYTIPWVFNEFFELIDPVGSIAKVELLTSPVCSSSIVVPSGFRTLTILDSHSFQSIFSMPQVVQFDRIKTVHLTYVNWPVGLHLPAVHHLSLTNNLFALTSFSSFPPSIRSMQIVLRTDMPYSTCSNWSVLRSITALSKLTSLSIILRDMNTGLDQSTCQIIAETVTNLVHFGIHFRHGCPLMAPDYSDCGDEIDRQLLADFDISTEIDGEDYTMLFLIGLYEKYRMSIEEIRCRLLELPLHPEAHITVEDEGCGMTVWF